MKLYEYTFFSSFLGVKLSLVDKRPFLILISIISEDDMTNKMIYET
jgi:hypothetical protein